MADTRYILCATVADDNIADLWEHFEEACAETNATILVMVSNGVPTVASRSDLKLYSTSREASELAHAKRLADELRHAYDTLHRLTPDSIDVGRMADLLRQVGRL